MTGGGKRHKNCLKSIYYLSNIFKNLKYFTKELAQILKSCNEEELSRGVVLIEFAVCMPVLIILLFYVNDLMQLKRLHSQTEFVAQQFANIIQNISQKREGAKRKITCNDIRYAASLAYLSMFPGTSRFVSQKNVSELGYCPHGYVVCVKGNSDSTASVLWNRRFHFTHNALNPSSVILDQSSFHRSNIKILTNAVPSEIYPTLKINPGEIKIIIECNVHYSQSSNYSFTDGRKTSKVSPSEAFGLRLYKLSPPVTRGREEGWPNDGIYFHAAVIFTPKPGLFDETPPQ